MKIDTKQSERFIGYYKRGMELSGNSHLVALGWEGSGGCSQMSSSKFFFVLSVLCSSCVQ